MLGPFCSAAEIVALADIVVLYIGVAMHVYKDVSYNSRTVHDKRLQLSRLLLPF